jgi:hypothetical protein
MPGRPPHDSKSGRQTATEAEPGNLLLTAPADGGTMAK